MPVTVATLAGGMQLGKLTTVTGMFLIGSGQRRDHSGWHGPGTRSLSDKEPASEPESRADGRSPA